MAEKRRFLDVWVIESNTVYREVPYQVVTDWVQQGRLLEDDMLRWSGKADWFKVGSTPHFQAYLPKAEEYAAEDKAEALEPASLGFTWKRRREEDEGDVDMIPLIDVSLVLLVFFMMTTTGAAALSTINTPEASRSLVVSIPLVYVGIDQDGEGNVVYSLGEGERAPAPEDQNLTKEQVLQRLDQWLGEKSVQAISVNADRDLPSRYVRDLTAELEKRSRVIQKYQGVSEPR